jgi:hypothetical protein
VPARCFRLQKSASGAEVQRSVTPVGSGARGRGPGSRELRKGLPGVKRRREPESRWPSRETGELQSRALERASRGKGSCSMEGISDHPFSSHRSCDRADGGLGGFHGCARRASDMTAVGKRQGCQRFGQHASRREDNAHRGDTTTTCVPPKRVALT